MFSGPPPVRTLAATPLLTVTARASNPADRLPSSAPAAWTAPETRCAPAWSVSSREPLSDQLKIQLPRIG